jgi:FG-GAP repeat
MAGQSSGWGIVRRQAVVAVVASGVAVGVGLAVAPVAQASGGASSHLPNYLMSKLASSKSRPSGYLGSKVAISGKTVVVDADGTSVHGQPSAGAIYVFTRSKSGKGRLTQRAVISAPGEESGDEVGPVAVSGNTIVVGEEYATVGATDDAGAAYIFKKPASGWKNTSHPTATLTLGTAVEDAHVGASVAITGKTIVVGAPGQTVGANSNQGEVLVYTKPAHGWADSSTPVELTSAAGMEDDDLGWSVAITGGTIIAGAPDRDIGLRDDVGIADVFVKPQSGGWVTGTETRELDPKPATAELGFGNVVAVANGHAAVAGEGDDNPSDLVHPAVFEFNEPAAGWGAGADPPLHPKARLTAAPSGPYDAFGQSIAISSSMIVAGAPYAALNRKYDSGAVYVFDKPKNGWHNAKQSTQFIAANTERWDSFGYAVALSGSTIVVGAPYADFTGAHNADDRGTAYVFTEKHKAVK